MANINVKFKKILKEIEEKIKNKEDLEYIKVQIFEIYNLLFEEISKLEEVANDKMSAVLEAQVGLEGRIRKVEKEIDEIQDDIYGEDNEFSLTCPYCNEDFAMEGVESKEEVECPECNNIIELDWGSEDEGCGGCGCSGGGCGSHESEDDDM
ncbi:MAG: hypothetical protein FWC79_02215 [Oscillospiraceae bacterium]|nr:hypothetical protein [Oscillospiraceae bacterium]